MFVFICAHKLFKIIYIDLNYSITIIITGKQMNRYSSRHENFKILLKKSCKNKVFVCFEKLESLELAQDNLNEVNKMDTKELSSISFLFNTQSFPKLFFIVR